MRPNRNVDITVLDKIIHSSVWDNPLIRRGRTLSGGEVIIAPTADLSALGGWSTIRSILLHFIICAVGRIVPQHIYRLPGHFGLRLELLLECLRVHLQLLLDPLLRAGCGLLDLLCQL